MIWESQIPLPRRPFAKIIFKMGAKIFFERAKIFWNRAKFFSKVQNFFQKYFSRAHTKIFFINLFFTRAIWTGGKEDAKILNYFWEKSFLHAKKFLCARKKLFLQKYFSKIFSKIACFSRISEMRKSDWKNRIPLPRRPNWTKIFIFARFWSSEIFEIAGKFFIFRNFHFFKKVPKWKSARKVW